MSQICKGGERVRKKHETNTKKKGRQEEKEEGKEIKDERKTDESVHERQGRETRTRREK